MRSECWIGRIAATIGVCAAGALLLACGMVLGAGLAWPDIAKFIERFQSLIGALVAIVAAIVGAWAILEVEAQKRRRRADALRASLPVTLMELVDYAKDCTAALLLEMNQKSGHYGVPQLPGDPMCILVDLIEHGQPALQQPLVSAINRLQVQHARLVAFAAQLPLQPDPIQFHRRLLGVAEIHARTIGIFDYARRRIDLPRAGPSYDDVRSALQELLFQQPSVSDAFKLIDRLQSARGHLSTSLWPEDDV